MPLRRLSSSKTLKPSVRWRNAQTPLAGGMRAPWRMACLGAVLGAALSAFYWAPARWLADAVSHLSQEHVLLHTPQGSLWRGSAQLVLAGGANSRDHAALPGRMHWQLRWQQGAFRLHLRSDCCVTNGLQIALRPGWMQAQIEISDSTSHWPAQVLTGLGTPWNTVHPQGQLTLSTRNLQMQWQAGRWTLQGSMALDAIQVASRLSTLAPMGSYRLEMHGNAEGGSPTLALQTLEGHLHLAGQGQITGNRLRFRGEAQADEAHTGALSNLLNLLGRRNGARSIISLG